MSLHILIGHSLPGNRGAASALYVGPSGVELRAAQAAAGPHIASFTILNNALGLRKRNPAYDPAAPVPSVNPAPSVTPVTIPDDISGLKKPELQEALVAAIARIKELEASAPKVPRQQPQDGTGTDDPTGKLEGLEA